MTPEQFCYWLQGFSEIDGYPPTPDQWLVIKDHLAHVFEKKTPARTLDDIIRQDGWKEIRPGQYQPPIGTKITC